MDVVNPYKTRDGSQAETVDTTMSYSAYIMDDMDEHGSATYTWMLRVMSVLFVASRASMLVIISAGLNRGVHADMTRLISNKQSGKITISEDIEFGYTDNSVGCALPDLRYVLALSLGAVVVALAAWDVRKMRVWGARK